MKNIFIVIVSMLIVVIAISVIGVSVNSRKQVIQRQANKEFEKYLNKEFYGPDVITLINKAIDNNNSYNIEKDDNGYYIEDHENSILIDLEMITNEEKEETKIYRMEKINKLGITEFIKNFNTAKFKITKIEYHKINSKIKYIQVSQQY